MRVWHGVTLGLHRGIVRNGGVRWRAGGPLGQFGPDNDESARVAHFGERETFALFGSRC